MVIIGPIGRAKICFNLDTLRTIPKKMRKIANKMILLYPNGPSSTWTLIFCPNTFKALLLTIFLALPGANVSVVLNGGGWFWWVNSSKIDVWLVFVRGFNAGAVKISTSLLTLIACKFVILIDSAQKYTTMSFHMFGTSMFSVQGNTLLIYVNKCIKWHTFRK